MYSDFKVIERELDASFPYIDIYPLFDLHVGAPNFNNAVFQMWKNEVLNNPYGLVGYGGDLMNNGLKNSKTNTYSETMRPHEQKEFLYEELKPLIPRVLWEHRGNHEVRNEDLADNDPIYDLFCRWGIEDRYRQNACFIRVRFGSRRKCPSQKTTYGIVSTHGVSKNKHDRWVQTIDGADVFFAGHTHKSSEEEPGKLRFNLQRKSVSVVPYENIVVGSFLKYGDYALRGEYLPNAVGGFQKVRLYGNRKQVGYARGL